MNLRIIIAFPRQRATSSATDACCEGLRKMWTYLISRSSSRSVPLRHPIPGWGSFAADTVIELLLRGLPSIGRYLLASTPVEYVDHKRNRIIASAFFDVSSSFLFVRRSVDFVSLFCHEYHEMNYSEIDYDWKLLKFN